MDLHAALLKKLKEHTALTREDEKALLALPIKPVALKPNEDLVAQGEKPHASAVVLAGMLARYHTLGGGQRQYISFHIAGDWPDLQSLFVDKMDHAVCAIDGSMVGLISHRKLFALFEERPTVGFALWRETLIDAAIFREAITNNSKRTIRPRLAHFLCEQYYRAKAAGVLDGDVCRLPLSQDQIGDALGASLVTVNRAMQSLRKTDWFSLKGGRLKVRRWGHMAKYGQFDPAYLHLRKPS